MRLLIVEDEHKIANSLKKGLEQEAFSVDVAYDGIAGFDLAISETYDLILLDQMLPGMDGLTICKNLRSEQIHTPILILTAKSEISDKVNGLNCGADDYLTKPFAFEELLARIKALLRRPEKTIQTVLVCGDLKLDSISFKVERASKIILLTKKEFTLLEYLIRNKNKILSKDQIIAHIWDYEADVLHNTVEQYIRYLRKKIDKPFKNKMPLIHTIRGFGYMISDKNERNNING